MKKGLKQVTVPSFWLEGRVTVGRIDLMKKGLKLTSPHSPPLHLPPCWKDWPDEEGIETAKSQPKRYLIHAVGRIDLMKKGLKHFDHKGSKSSSFCGVGRIDLMKKGLKHHCGWHYQPQHHYYVGRIDLMKKGLKQISCSPSGEIRNMLEGLTWWRRDWNIILNNPLSLPFHCWKDWPDEEGIETAWLNNTTGRTGRSWKDWPDEEGIETVFHLAEWRPKWQCWKDWPDEEGIETFFCASLLAIYKYKLEGLTWWRRDWNRRWCRRQSRKTPWVGRIDLMKKGLKRFSVAPYLATFHSLEGLTWWRRDWNLFKVSMGIRTPSRWKDWPDEEGMKRQGRGVRCWRELGKNLMGWLW